MAHGDKNRHDYDDAKKESFFIDFSRCFVVKESMIIIAVSFAALLVRYCYPE
jgi:hypothetical protein